MNNYFNEYDEDNLFFDLMDEESYTGELGGGNLSSYERYNMDNIVDDNTIQGSEYDIQLGEEVADSVTNLNILMKQAILTESTNRDSLIKQMLIELDFLETVKDTNPFVMTNIDSLTSMAIAGLPEFASVSARFSKEFVSWINESQETRN